MVLLTLSYTKENLKGSDEMNSLIYVQVGVPISWKSEEGYHRQLSIRTAEGVETWEMKNRTDFLKSYLWELLETPYKEESLIRWVSQLEPDLDKQAVQTILSELQTERRAIGFDFEQPSQTLDDLVLREAGVQGYAKSGDNELAIDQQTIKVSHLAYEIWKQLQEGDTLKESIQKHTLGAYHLIQAIYELVSQRLIVLL